MNKIERIDHTFDLIKDDLKAMTLEIHANPELGMEEYQACELQMNLLKKYGFEVRNNYCGIPTSYIACYKGEKSGPKIAMLAEYDALPGIGHACGHNLIAMVACGAGIGMKEFADELGGEIYVIGTPAEETVGAKAIMADAGGFDEMDVIMMSHPGYFNLESANTLAIKSVYFDFYGKTAHASGMPEDGLNALDAVINTFVMINALRQQTQDDARIHGIITMGGDAPNIIPDHTQAHFFVRAEKIDYLESLFEKVCDCARAGAMGAGCRVEITLGEGQFCDTNSNKVLSKLNTKNMELLGEKMLPAPEKAIAGSTDMGNASYRCPAIQTIYDTTHWVEVPAHTVEFTECVKTEYALEQSVKCAKGHVLTAIDLMEDPAHLEAIREEFSGISKRPAELK